MRNLQPLKWKTHCQRSLTSQIRFSPPTLNHHIDPVIIFHPQIVRCISIIDSCTIIQEAKDKRRKVEARLSKPMQTCEISAGTGMDPPDGPNVLTDFGRIRILKLHQLRTALDLEKDFFPSRGCYLANAKYADPRSNSTCVVFHRYNINL